MTRWWNGVFSVLESALLIRTDKYRIVLAKEKVENLVLDRIERSSEN